MGKWIDWDGGGTFLDCPKGIVDTISRDGQKQYKWDTKYIRWTHMGEKSEWGGKDVIKYRMSKV